MNLKETIHQLVDGCDNEVVLYNTLATLNQSLPTQDWWTYMSETQKEKTRISLEQSDKGQTIAHEQVMEKICAKFTK